MTSRPWCISDNTISEFKTAPKTVAAPNNSVKSLADGISPFAKMVYDSTSIVFGYPQPNNLTNSPLNGSLRAAMTMKKSPNQRRSDTPKIVKHNPATINAQAAAYNKSRIEIHIPSQRQREAASSTLASQLTTAIPPTAAQSQPQTVSLADLMVRPQVSPIPVPKVERGPAISTLQAIPQAPRVTVPAASPISIQKVEEEVTPRKPSIPPYRESSSSAPSSQKQGEIRIELPRLLSIEKNSPWYQIRLMLQRTCLPRGVTMRLKIP